MQSFYQTVAACILLSQNIFMIKVVALSEFLLSDCTCVDSSLTFECTAIGPGATIWKGTAFSCPDNLNEIHLLHSQFQNRRATCNNGQISGYALDVPEDLHFRSRLIINITSAMMNGTTVECEYDDGADVHPLQSSNIVLTTEPLPPPVNIHLSNVRKGQLEFTWDPVAVTCSKVRYNIEASNCGRCPNTTLVASATCTDVEIIAKQNLTCTFRVSTVVCSNIVGMKNSIDVHLEVPDMSSSIIDVTPTYNNDTGHLKMLSTYFSKVKNTSFSFSNISGAATNYTVVYTDSETGQSCGKATISAASCVKEICKHAVEIPLSTCPQPVNFNVTVFGTNVLGDGNSSKAITRDYNNSFVDVDAISSSVRCIFLSKSNSSKWFNITYFDELCQNQILNLSANTTEDSVSVSLDSLPDQNNIVYCFLSTASDDSLTVKINGTYDVIARPGMTQSSSVSTIIILINIAGAIILLGILLLIIVIVYRFRARNKIKLRKCKMTNIRLDVCN